jgi:hypothetical protein
VISWFARDHLWKTRLHDCLDNRGSDHCSHNNSTIMANMDELSFKDMCKDNMNMLYEGFDYLTNG